MSKLIATRVPADWSVEAGRGLYLAENGFQLSGYDAKTTPAVFFGFTVQVPNTPKHAWAIRLHDLHHVVTGYGTDLTGECEVSAWELRKGLAPLGLYVGSIVLSLALLGLLVAPRRTLRAYRASSPGPSLFHEPFGDYGSLLTRTVGDLRAGLGVPPNGVAKRPGGLHAGALKQAG